MGELIPGGVSGQIELDEVCPRCGGSLRGVFTPAQHGWHQQSMGCSRCGGQLLVLDGVIARAIQVPRMALGIARAVVMWSFEASLIWAILVAPLLFVLGRGRGLDIVWTVLVTLSLTCVGMLSIREFGMPRVSRTLAHMVRTVRGARLLPGVPMAGGVMFDAHVPLLRGARTDAPTLVEEACPRCGVLQRVEVPRHEHTLSCAHCSGTALVIHTRRDRVGVLVPVVEGVLFGSLPALVVTAMFAGATALIIAMVVKGTFEAVFLLLWGFSLALFVGTGVGMVLPALRNMRSAVSGRRLIQAMQMGQGWLEPSLNAKKTLWRARGDETLHGALTHAVEGGPERGGLTQASGAGGDLSLTSSPADPAASTDGERHHE